MGINTINNNRRPFNLILVILIVLGCIFGDIILRYEIQENKREQARYNLDQVKYCYLNSVAEFGVQKALKLCTAKSKTSFTGDVYILDANTLQFIQENSNDVPEDGLYFTKESVGKYFQDWNSAIIALKTMQLGKDSQMNVNASYKFNDGIEWLEWKYLPEDVKNTNGLSLIAVQGTQQDEALVNFKFVRGYFFFGAFLLIMVLLIVHNNNIRRTRD